MPQGATQYNRLRRAYTDHTIEALCLIQRAAEELKNAHQILYRSNEVNDAVPEKRAVNSNRDAS